MRKRVSILLGLSLHYVCLYSYSVFEISVGIQYFDPLQDQLYHWGIYPSKGLCLTTEILFHLCHCCFVHNNQPRCPSSDECIVKM